MRQMTMEAVPLDGVVEIRRLATGEVVGSGPTEHAAILDARSKHPCQNCQGRGWHLPRFSADHGVKCAPCGGSGIEGLFAQPDRAA